jgi:ferredoxin
MPSKYVIHTRPVAARMKPITKSGIVAWEEGCLKCAVCVKKRCVHKVYDRRGLDAKQMVDSIDNECMNCLRCVQGCPKELIHKTLNPEFREMGDSTWTPEIISKLWYQAETGKIPVSGAGYPGPFSGPGFDSMWTDMSEIVRPTRDGIHGREYISTAIDLGGTDHHIHARNEGHSTAPIDIPIPILLKVPAFGAYGSNTVKGWAMAAKHLGTFLSVGAGESKRELAEYRSQLIPQKTADTTGSWVSRVRSTIVEAPWTPEISKRGLPSGLKFLLSVLVPAEEGVEEKVLSLAQSGVPIIHLAAGENGESAGERPVFVIDLIRKVHSALLDAGIRDGVTLLVSGGLSMAEHVAKSILCGADGVFVDLPLLISLGCRMCRRCTKGLPCPADILGAPSAWVAGRVVNMIGAWHSQLLEMMGAMGIRDVRRLRGETGRAMFFEDLDKASFRELGRMEEGWELE